MAGSIFWEVVKVGTHTGRVAIVTGGAKGIGKGIALALAERGARIALVDLDSVADTAREIESLGGEALEVQADCTSPDDWVRVREAVLTRFGKIDILVNNVGLCPFTPLEQLDYATWSRVLRINLDTAFLGSTTIAPALIENGWGRIVNLSSDAVASTLTGLVHYISSKMGVIGLTRAMANELGKHGIAVNAIAPAITETPGTSGTPDEVKAMVWGQQPISRFAQPQDMANAVAFLTSEEASLITGQVLMVNGGVNKSC